MQAIGAILLILIIYLLYQLIVFLFNSGLLLITVLVLLGIFILWIFIGADNAVKKEKREKEEQKELEDKWNLKYGEWVKENASVLEIQKSYEEKEYSKINMSYQFNELSTRYETVKNREKNKSNLTQSEKDKLKIERRFLRDLGERIINEKFWRNSYGAHRIFYIFIEDSVLKIREKIIFGSKFLNESLDIRIENIFYYQESGKIEARERKAGYVRQSKSPGVIESAIVGGLIAGSTGAIVGGMAGMNNTNQRSNEYTITEYNDNRIISLFYKDKDGKNRVYQFMDLNNYNATWKILAELIPDKSYEEIALQNGNFHLLNI